jgi:uncharacterized membrane protein
MMAVAGLALALFLVMLWGIVEAERGRPPEAPPATSGTSLHDVLARYASGELSRQDFIRIVRDMDPEGARGMP